MEIGNQMQNHKIEIKSELLYEDGSILSTSIFIKIIGSDALRFPLPPSEVLVFMHSRIIKKTKEVIHHLKFAMYMHLSHIPKMCYTCDII